MMYLGDYAEDSTIDLKWSSNNSDGAAITRATNGTISVYKANGTTQSTAGITDTEDFDTLTGIHHVRIDTSADAFYAVANDYMVVLSAATIDGQTVNAVLAHFSIENRYMRGTDSANTTTPPTATAIRTEIDSNSTQLAAIVADTNELQTDDVPGLIAALNDGDATAVNQTTIINYVDELESRLTAARAALLDNLDAAISTRLATAGYTAPDNASITSILTDTDFLQILLDELITGTTPNRAYTTAALANAPAGGGGGLALDDFFDTDSGEAAGTAVSGSVVGEIVASITGGGIPGSVEVTDIVIDDGSSPIEGADVWINTSATNSQTNVLFRGVTDANGSPKDTNNENPFLDPGTYYVWVQKGGISFSNPTTETVS